MSPTLMYTQQLAEKLGKTTEAVRMLRCRDPQSLPPPNGRIGRRDYWLSDSVDDWLRNGGKRAYKRRGRPRLVPENINVTSV